MATKVTRTSGGRPQVQDVTETARAWTKAKQEQFLEHLAATCNVRASCRAVGLSEPGAYKRKKADAGFRASWARAVAEAVGRLELMLIERAMKGTVKTHVTREGVKLRTTEYPDRIALSLIRVHKEEARQAEGDAIEDEPIEAVRARIARKLDMLVRREAAKAAKTKAGSGSIAEDATGRETRGSECRAKSRMTKKSGVAK